MLGTYAYFRVATTFLARTALHSNLEHASDRMATTKCRWLRNYLKASIRVGKLLLGI